MKTLTCQLMQREYKVKKVCKISEMPQNAKYFNTIYFDKQCQQIYRTDSGILYARTQSLLELGY